MQTLMRRLKIKAPELATFTPVAGGIVSQISQNKRNYEMFECGDFSIEGFILRNFHTFSASH